MQTTDADAVSALASGQPTATFFYRAAGAALRIPVAILYRPSVRGLEHVPDGGFVLCPNQLSNMDTVAIPLALRPRPMRAMGKAELWNPVLGPILTALGGFPVHRDHVDRQAVANAVAAVRDGHALLLFPEGTRRAKGHHKNREPRPHDGAAFIALRAGVPIVPAAIRGTESLTRLRRWRIEIGSPIDIAPFAALPGRVARRELTRELWQRILDLELRLDEETGRS